MAKSLCIERDDDIAIIVLTRPDRLNALDLDMAQSLLESLQELRYDRTVSSVVMTGSGRSFCAGGDLLWVRSQTAGVESAFHTLAGYLHQSITEMASLEKPVIAAINGIAAGAGFSLALAADFRIMDRAATLKQAYTSVGLSIDGGGTFVLPRLIGLAAALEIAGLDLPINAERAHSMGLVTRLAEEGRSLDAARELARELSGRSLSSFAWSKRLLRNSCQNSLESQLEWERQGLVSCAASPEGKEGLEAFAAKRQPEYRRTRTHRF